VGGEGKRKKKRTGLSFSLHLFLLGPVAKTATKGEKKKRREEKRKKGFFAVSRLVTLISLIFFLDRGLRPRTERGKEKVVPHPPFCCCGGVL